MARTLLDGQLVAWGRQRPKMSQVFHRASRPVRPALSLRQRAPLCSMPEIRPPATVLVASADVRS
jgi:hypothetical protein